MIVMTREPSTPANLLLKDFLAFETREGYRVELINGEIVVSPPPDGGHEDIVGLITEQVIEHSKLRMRLAGNKGLILGTEETGGDYRVIPDLTIAPAERRLFRGAPPWMHVAGVTMVVEVTSARPDLDRGSKRLGYAIAGVPFYLLVDRERGHVTLFSGPLEDDYARYVAVAFGEKLELPESFAFALDTAEFALSQAAGSAA
jgi:Uma2 family endonuclease